MCPSQIIAMILLHERLHPMDAVYRHVTHKPDARPHVVQRFDLLLQIIKHMYELLRRLVPETEEGLEMAGTLLHIDWTIVGCTTSLSTLDGLAVFLHRDRRVRLVGDFGQLDGSGFEERLERDVIPSRPK
jgi:hypothetical protein